MDSNELNWLAGILDMGVSFTAKFYSQDTRMPLTLRAEVTVPAGSSDVLDEIIDLLGVGSILTRLGPSGWGPTATWRVSGKECQQLLDNLDRCPLRSTKQREYALWAEIVRTYTLFKQGRGARSRNQPHIETIQALSRQLQEVRAYDSVREEAPSHHRSPRDGREPV